MALPHRRHNSMSSRQNNPRGRRHPFNEADNPYNTQQSFTPGWPFPQPHRESDALMARYPFDPSTGIFGAQARPARSSPHTPSSSSSEPTATPQAQAQAPADADIEGAEADDLYANVPAHVRQHARFPELMQACERVREFGPMHPRSRPYQLIVQDIMADMWREGRGRARGGDAQRCPVHAEHAPFPDDPWQCTCAKRTDSRGGRGRARDGEEWYGGYGGGNHRRGLDTSCLMM